MFYLLYMNSAADPELTDFHEKVSRCYAVEGDEIGIRGKITTRSLVLLRARNPRQE